MAKYSKPSFSRFSQQIFQLIILVLAKIVLQPFSRAEIPPNLRSFASRKPCIFVANHRRAFDPFVVCSGLPLKVILRTLPIGFITHNAFYDSPLRPLLWLMGCYPAKNPKGESRLAGIDASIDFVRRGYSIFIFPEGTRMQHKTRGQAKWGVIKIHQAVPNMAIILAHIEYRPGLKNCLQRRYRTVTYRLIEKPKFDTPETIMDAIYGL